MSAPPGVRDASRRTINNPFIGENVTFVKYSYETSGEYSEVLLDCAPNGGPPAHYHNAFAERFELVKGDITLRINDKMVAAEQGKQYLVEAGTVHRFTSSAGGQLRIRVYPGHEGFEQSLYVLFGLAKDGLVNENGIPKSLVHIAVIGGLGDQRLAGAALTNVALTAAEMYGRWSGTQAELLRKYWD